MKFACALNSAYFGGDLTGIPELDRDGTLLLRWKESGTMFGGYLASLEEEIGKDYRSWEGAG